MAGLEIDVEGNPVYRYVGISLAVLSGILIGVSFILKKKGLISSRVDGDEDGHQYLRSAMWWSGMILMALGEVTNFIALIMAPAVLVTPLGALSVVISAILSHFILKESLNFHGKIGCLICLLGSVIVVLHAPEQNAPTNIPDFMKLALAPGFLTYTIVIILGSIFLAFKVAPKYGKKHPLIYVSICSFIGSLSVVTLQALGGSILSTINGNNQFGYWFIYLLIAFVAITIITQINFLNKALNEFVTAEVTPIYYVVFTTATIVSSAVLFQGFAAEPVSIVTLILAFFSICGGVIILQTSRMYQTLYEVDHLKDEKGCLSPIESNPEEPSSASTQMLSERLPSEHRIPQKAFTEDPSTHTSYTLNVPDSNDYNSAVRVSSSRSATPHPKTSALPPHLKHTLRPQSSRSSTFSQNSNGSVLVRLGSFIHPEKDDHLKRRTVFTDEQLEGSLIERKRSHANSEKFPRTKVNSTYEQTAPDDRSQHSSQSESSGKLKYLINSLTNQKGKSRKRSTSSPSRPMSQVIPEAQIVEEPSSIKAIDEESEPYYSPLTSPTASSAQQFTKPTSPLSRHG